MTNKDKILIHNEDLATCEICKKLLHSGEGIEIGYDSDIGWEYRCRICYYND